MKKYTIANTIWSFKFLNDFSFDKNFEKFETNTNDDPIHSIEFYQVDEFKNPNNDLNIKDKSGKTIIQIEYLTNKTIFYVKSSLRNKKHYQYVLTTLRFGEVMEELGLLLLRASCVEVSGGALIIAGNKKSGKTTFMDMWLSKFKSSTFISNDVILIKPNKLGGFVYSTPFSGKQVTNKKCEITVNGLLILDRSTKNEFIKLTEMDKIVETVQKVQISENIDVKSKLINYCSCLVNTTKVVKYSGQITEEAVNSIFDELYIK